MSGAGLEAVTWPIAGQDLECDRAAHNGMARARILILLTLCFPRQFAVYIDVCDISELSERKSIRRRKKTRVYRAPYRKSFDAQHV